MRILIKAFLYAAFGWLVLKNYQPNVVYEQTVHINR